MAEVRVSKKQGPGSMYLYEKKDKVTSSKLNSGSINPKQISYQRNTLILFLQLILAVELLNTGHIKGRCVTTRKESVGEKFSETRYKTSQQWMSSVVSLHVQSTAVINCGVLTDGLCRGGTGWWEVLCEVDVAHVAAAAAEVICPILDLWREVGHYTAFVTATLVVAQVSPAT